jgi:cytosine/adenosine deaminase-related metal-dependent hydrolase
MSQTILRGGLVLPLDGSEDWHNPGAVCFEDGTITYVGRVEGAPPAQPDAVVVD